MDAFRRQGAGEDIEQIGAVHGQKFGAVALHDIAAALLPGDDPATAIATDHLIGSLILDGDGGVFHAERPERLQRVGAEIESGADFAEFRGFFVNFRLDAALMKLERRRRDRRR